MPPVNIPNKEQRKMLSPAGHRDIRLPTTRPPCLFCHGSLRFSRAHILPTASPSADTIRLLVNRGREEALGVVDVHRLHVAVQLLLGALLVVSLPGDSHAESEGDALDAAFPDLLVELGVEADVGGALYAVCVNMPLIAEVGASAETGTRYRTICWWANLRISLMALGALVLKVAPCSYRETRQ